MALKNDFNDKYFEESSEFFRELVETIKDDFSEKPKLDDLLELVLWGLKNLPDDSLEDVAPCNIESLKVKSNSKKVYKLSAGDLVAIPIEKNKYVYSLFIEGNRFGQAFGIFKGVHSLNYINLYF